MKFISLNLLLFIIMLTSCNKNASNELLFQNEQFQLYGNRVIQGSNEATAKSSIQIKSNYRSPATSTFSRFIEFKFSINEKDNELPFAVNHWVYIEDQNETPIIKFGEIPEPAPDFSNHYLPPNYEFTFKLDFSPVADQFEKNGFFTTHDGTKISKTDFKGVYIAGGGEPLSWDFVNLENHGLKLQETAEKNIYEITVVLNPYDENLNKEKSWEPELDISQKPQYQSDQLIVDALYNLSLEEAIKNIEADSTLRTGAKWGGVWTRDISYSIFLAFAYHEPEIAKISLMKKVNRNRIVQDTGSGGAWPVSSDRNTWAIAAWELYKVTGDTTWLKQSYEIIKNTLEDDLKTISQTNTGLMRGESSFLDWREQSYPKWMDNVDIFQSQNLGTNVVHYKAYSILSQMALLLGEPYEKYEQKAIQIRDAINYNLWREVYLPHGGYYAQYLYGRNNLVQSDKFETLGEALAVIFGVADIEKSKTIISNSPLTPYGTTCFYPQIAGIPPYHNNAIWPFVQSYWNLAAAKAGNERALEHGLASIYRAGALFLTNYENFVAESGDYLGTEINSDRMLWSMAGNLAMVHRVFFGMDFATDRLYLNPVIPKVYGGKRTLRNFKYRDAILNIEVTGYGNRIKSFKIDGKEREGNFFSGGLPGEHDIEILMANNSFDDERINETNNHTAPETPRVQIKKAPESQDSLVLMWNKIEGASRYSVYKNGLPYRQTSSTRFFVNNSDEAEYSISAIDSLEWESFLSEPVYITNLPAIKIPFGQTSTNTPGKHREVLKISTDSNQLIEKVVSVKSEGRYRLRIRYANGSGPWNTDNKCAIRSLFVNNTYTGPIIFPQRGLDEWGDWGWSNSYLVNLHTGENSIKIVYSEWNVNMNVEINEALIDYIELQKEG